MSKYLSNDGEDIRLISEPSERMLVNLHFWKTQMEIAGHWHFAEIIGKWIDDLIEIDKSQRGLQ